MAENVLYYGDNYEHRTGRAIHKRGPLGFLGYNRWPYFLFNLSACPCFCPCQSVSMKYSAAISKANRLTLSILTSQIPLMSFPHVVGGNPEYLPATLFGGLVCLRRAQR